MDSTEKFSTSDVKGDGSPVRSLEQEHGGRISSKTIILVLAVNCCYYAQLINVVAAGAYARDIATVVGGSTQSVWLSVAITIGTVVLSPPVSQASDYWGRKWLLVTLTFCGCIGSIIVSRATSMGMAIAGEVIAGLSFGSQPLLHAVTSEVLPRKYRPAAQAGVNITACLGGITALIVGGALTRTNPEGFRSYWYMAAAVYFVASIICALLYNPPLRELQTTLTQKEKFCRLDWIGYALLILGLILFCMGLSWAENPYPWTDAHVLAPFLIGVAIAAILVIYEARFTKVGMFHHRLFTEGNRNFPIALVCVFVEGVVFFVANSYFAFETSTIYEPDPLINGVRYSVFFIVYIFVALSGSWYCCRYKTIRIPTALAFGALVLFNILMAAPTTSPSTPTQTWAWPIFLGIGLGIPLPALVTAAQLSTPPDLIAITTGLMISVRSLGGAIGLPIFSAIFSNGLSSNLAPEIAAATLPLGLPISSLSGLISALNSGNTAALGQVPDVNDQIIEAAGEALKEAYTIAFRYVWVASGCFTVIAVVGSLFLFDPKGDFNGNIDAPAEMEEEKKGLFGRREKV